MEHTTTRTERVCITCAALGRDGEDGRPAPNYYDYRWACEACRPQLHGLLHRIPLAHTQLDATPTGTHHEHVTGTVEAPLGVSIAVLDQITRTPAMFAPYIPWDDDQTGHLPTTRTLQIIATAWLPALQERNPREHLPNPEVKPLTAWLSHHLDWACNNLKENLPDHAHELSALAHRLDRLLDPGTDKPEAIPFVPCRECDRYSLARHRGDIICTDTRCNARMSPTEYERWTKLKAAFEQAA